MTHSRKSYTLKRPAMADLEEIWQYTFERWSREQADKYHGDLVRTFEALADGIRRGREVDYIRVGYRRITTGSHYVFYREASSGIEIMRILHQAMDIESHL
jgi:toxin ParE1/3/4